jgi:hypothetical protein
MPPYRPEVLTAETGRAWRRAAKHLRRGAEGRIAALGALVDAGYTDSQAARIVRTMIALMTP